MIGSDNAAYQLIGVLTAEDPGYLFRGMIPCYPNWDMAIIGEVVDAVKESHHQKRSAIPAILSTVMRGACYLDGRVR